MSASDRSSSPLGTVLHKGHSQDLVTSCTRLEKIGRFKPLPLVALPQLTSRESRRTTYLKLRYELGCNGCGNRKGVGVIGRETRTRRASVWIASNKDVNVITYRLSSR